MKAQQLSQSDWPCFASSGESDAGPLGLYVCCHDACCFGGRVFVYSYDRVAAHVGYGCFWEVWVEERNWWALSMKSAYEKNAAWEVLLPGQDDVQAQHEEDNEQEAFHMTAADKKEDTRPGAGSQASQLAQHVVDMNHRREDMEPVLVRVVQEDELRILLGQQEEHRKMMEGIAVVDMLEGHSRLSSE